MANRKISDLTALTAPATGDLLPIVDISEAAAADKNKKITLGTLLSGAPLGSATAPSFAFSGDSNTGIYSPGADQLAIATGGAVRLIIDSDGAIIADGRNGAAAQIYYSILPSPGTGRNHFLGNTVGLGSWTLQGNGTSTWTSDERRKKNIETTRDGYLEDLARLRVVKYNWKVHSDNDPKELGLIAQEVEQVFPGLVIEANEPQDGDDYKLKSVKFSVLPFMLLKALQEAAHKIETLETRLSAIEGA